MKKIVALTLALLLIAGTACAVCTPTSYTMRVTNYRACAMGCGFLGIIWKQDVWDETYIYYCKEGGTNVKVTEYCHNHKCCY